MASFPDPLASVAWLFPQVLPSHFMRQKGWGGGAWERGYASMTPSLSPNTTHTQAVWVSGKELHAETATDSDNPRGESWPMNLFLGHELTDMDVHLAMIIGCDSLLLFDVFV